MKESEFKLILDRKKHETDAKKVYEKQISLLDDLVNYGSNLVARAYDSSDKKLTAIVTIGVLLKQIISMVDAISIMIAHGIVIPARLQVRCAFEALLYMEYILKDDSDVKARYYYVANLRNERLWALRILEESDERKQFQHVFDFMEKQQVFNSPEMKIVAQNRIAEINAFLDKEKYSDIIEHFVKVKSRKTNDEGFWYKAYGVKSLRSMAQAVNRLSQYDIFYQSGSSVIHSKSYRDHICFKKGLLKFEPIRKLSDARETLQEIIPIVLDAFRAILTRYRYGELSHFRRKYIQDWREAYQNIPDVDYNEIQGNILGH